MMSHWLDGKRFYMPIHENAKSKNVVLEDSLSIDFSEISRMDNTDSWVMSEPVYIITDNFGEFIFEQKVNIIIEHGTVSWYNNDKSTNKFQINNHNLCKIIGVHIGKEYCNTLTKAYEIMEEDDTIFTLRFSACEFIVFRADNSQQCRKITNVIKIARARSINDNYQSLLKDIKSLSVQEK